MQTGEAKRFQEYVDNWANPGNTEGTLYPIDTIDTVPVSFFTAEYDQICDPSVAVTESAKI